MKLWRVLVSAFAFPFLTLSPTLAKEWRGILPLHSTRADVDRLIGSKSINCGTRSCLYDLGDETVFVLYAGEPTCKNDDATTFWKVPRDTVIEISVRFKKDRKLSELGLDLKNYEKVQDKELPAGFITQIARRVWKSKEVL